MSAHTFHDRNLAPWWLWAILIAGVAVIWGAAAMEVL